MNERMAQVAYELDKLVLIASKEMKALSDGETTVRPAEGKWSKKEILGHIIDSAVNNHHRFVRAQTCDELSFPDYKQSDWVRLENYNERPWEELVELWRLYNRHLAHVIRYIRSERLDTPCRIGENEASTLQFIVEDYPVHMMHHVRQIVGDVG